ncbi:hypothetical protein RhiirA4_448981 [Rhizophagus irregularis]|uniref:Uncharacterized protein n=1 Tax=Rhizophagus irregularis TaxID=588596 RepID=A0A2I1HEL6_9GLOM|nr:hypothetical protein RhiirA4_448981 [Rhizophagus irregularis]
MSQTSVCGALPFGVVKFWIVNNRDSINTLQLKKILNFSGKFKKKGKKNRNKTNLKRLAQEYTVKEITGVVIYLKIKAFIPSDRNIETKIEDFEVGQKYIPEEIQMDPLNYRVGKCIILAGLPRDVTKSYLEEYLIQKSNKRFELAEAATISDTSNG